MKFYTIKQSFNDIKSKILTTRLKKSVVHSKQFEFWFKTNSRAFLNLWSSFGAFNCLCAIYRPHNCFSTRFSGSLNRCKCSRLLQNWRILWPELHEPGFPPEWPQVKFYSLVCSWNFLYLLFLIILLYCHNVNSYIHLETAKFDVAPMVVLYRVTEAFVQWQ